MSGVFTKLASVVRPGSGRRARPFPIYAVMLYVGLITGLVVGDALARRTGLDPMRVVAAFLVSIPVCLAGARALAVALNWSYYRERPREIVRLGHGGAAMYGAIPPTLLLSIPLLAWFGIPFGEFWDVAVVAILAGMIPTRLGCLGAGCCAGRPTAGRFGMRLRNAHGVVERRFPSPLLEAALGGLLLGASLLLFDRLPSPGAVALFAIAGYGAGRLFLEALREEHAPRFMGLGEFQWMSAAMLVVGTLGLIGLIGLDGLGADGTEKIIASGPLPPELGGTGTAHLFAAGILLLPIVHLFRFLGCTLLLSESGPSEPTHILQMIVIVPDLGSGDVSVTMRFEKEPELAEIDESPVDLAPAGVEADGRLNFEALAEIPEGAYRATCTVSRTGALTRIGSCSGELTGNGLALAFNAEIGDAAAALSTRLCFQAVPSA